MRLRGELPSHINVASLHRLLMLGCPHPIVVSDGPSAAAAATTAAAAAANIAGADVPGAPIIDEDHEVVPRLSFS